MRSAARDARDRVFTRREYMVYRAVMAGAPALQATTAVASTALDHPEWDMDETMTWAQWEAHVRRVRAAGRRSTTTH